MASGTSAACDATSEQTLGTCFRPAYSEADSAAQLPDVSEPADEPCHRHGRADRAVRHERAGCRCAPWMPPAGDRELSYWAAGCNRDRPPVSRPYQVVM